MYGYHGWHKCYDTYSIGVAVEHPSGGCYEVRRYDLYGDGGYPISLYDRFKVHAVAKSVPISYTHKIWINAYANGGTYQHGR
jgi:hypothetical protein